MSKARAKEQQQREAVQEAAAPKQAKGKTNLVRLRNNSTKESGRLISRAKRIERADGEHIARMVRSNPGKAAFYDGNNRAVQVMALGNPKADPPVQPVLTPADDRARAWLKEVRADEERIQAELAEEM
jgi:hypothetical protein